MNILNKKLILYSRFEELYKNLEQIPECAKVIYNIKLVKDSLNELEEYLIKKRLGEVQNEH